MPHSPDREHESNMDQRPTGIPFSPLLTDEQLRVFNNLRLQLVQALEKQDYEFSGELISQLPKLRGEHLAKIVKSLQPYPQSLALFLDLMDDEELEEFIDATPDEV